MVTSIFASVADDATRIALIGTIAGATVTFAGVLVRQTVAASKMTSDQSDKWQGMVTAVERRAEIAERRAEGAEVRAEAAERKATLAEGRADLLDLQLDEVRNQLDELRRTIAAAEPMPRKDQT